MSIQFFPKFKQKARKQISAFSLLEVTLALAVIGLAMGTVTPIIKTFSIAKKSRINEEKFHYIRIAMQGYLLRHGHLPHAGDKEGNEISGQKRGFVPYKSLGIRKQYAYDSNSNFFTYAVNLNLTAQPNKKFIPITIPLTTPPKPGMISFLRLYKFNTDGSIDMYDDIDETKNIIVIENKNEVISDKDCIYIMKPLPKFHLPQMIGQWLIASNMIDPKYKCSNLIAWVLISHGKQRADDSVAKKSNATSDIHFYVNSSNGLNDQVFYQTRFDMTAQCGFYCTNEPIYSEKINTTWEFK
jgi:type II secretory pathway pseudopilin PulG